MRTTLFVLVASFTLSLACKKQNPYQHFPSSASTLVVNYEEFGPQSIAYELIGNQWWQWDNHGDSDPNTTYDIRVVIYKDAALETVMKQYPLNASKNIDFRYASYQQSIEYLDSIIEEFNHDFDTKKYSDLKEKIISHFGS